MSSIQQYFNHLKNLTMADHFIRRKTRQKPDHFSVLLEIKAGGKLDINRFYKTFRMSRTTFYSGISLKRTPLVQKKLSAL